MKLSKREVNLLLVFFGVLIVFLAYRFVYVKMNDKAEELAQQSAAMETEIAVWQAHLPRQEFYETETARMRMEINDWLAEFEAYILPEDDLKFAYQQDNRNTDAYVFINSISFTEPSLLYTTNQRAENTYESSVSVMGENLYPTYYLYGQQTSYGLECSYDGLKSLVNNVFKEEGRKGIDSISLTFNETTGQLSGSMVMNSYFIQGLDKIYTQPDLTPVRQGADNIFGTVENRIVTGEAEEAIE